VTNAIIYARFSPRRNAETSDSNEIQKAYCEQHAHDKKYTVAGFHEDKALSGSDADRPALWAALEQLEKGSVLLVYKLDRLARNVYLMELIKQAVKTCGARIEAVEGDVEGDTAESVLIRQILSSISEYERKIIALRTKFAMQQHQRNGKRMGRFPPYGFQIDPEDNTMLIPVELEQKAIVRIWAMKAEGYETMQIARKMNHEKLHKTRNGNRWARKQIDKILSNHKQIKGDSK